MASLNPIQLAGVVCGVDIPKEIRKKPLQDQANFMIDALKVLKLLPSAQVDKIRLAKVDAHISSLEKEFVQNRVLSVQVGNAIPVPKKAQVNVDQLLANYQKSSSKDKVQIFKQISQYDNKTQEALVTQANKWFSQSVNNYSVPLGEKLSVALLIQKFAQPANRNQSGFNDVDFIIDEANSMMRDYQVQAEPQEGDERIRFDEDINTIDSLITAGALNSQKCNVIFIKSLASMMLKSLERNSENPSLAWGVCNAISEQNDPQLATQFLRELAQQVRKGMKGLGEDKAIGAVVNQLNNLMLKYEEKIKKTVGGESGELAEAIRNAMVEDRFVQVLRETSNTLELLQQAQPQPQSQVQPQQQKQAELQPQKQAQPQPLQQVQPQPQQQVQPQVVAQQPAIAPKVAIDFQKKLLDHLTVTLKNAELDSERQINEQFITNLEGDLRALPKEKQIETIAQIVGTLFQRGRASLEERNIFSKMLEFYAKEVLKIDPMTVSFAQPQMSQKLEASKKLMQVELLMPIAEKCIPQGEGLYPEQQRKAKIQDLKDDLVAFLVTWVDYVQVMSGEEL